MTQCEYIKDYMERFGSITALEAMKDLGVMRLAARISDLERQGVEIFRKQESSKNRFNKTTYYTRYSLKRDVA